MSIYIIHIHMCRVVCWAVSLSSLHFSFWLLSDLQENCPLVIWEIFEWYPGKRHVCIFLKRVLAESWCCSIFITRVLFQFLLREYFVLIFHYASTVYQRDKPVDMISLSVQQQHLKIKISDHIAVKMDLTWRYATHDMNPQKENMRIAYARTKR